MKPSKKIILGLPLFIITSCNQPIDQPEKLEHLTAPEPIVQQGDMFILEAVPHQNVVRIIPPKKSNFEFPDTSVTPEVFKTGDFNADGKKDILVYLGACGTGGCMYALFLRRNKQFFILAFLDYLKNPEFKIEKDGLWTIESYEELEPYNPSRIQKTVFKFDQDSYHYQVDSSFVLSNGEIE